MKIENCKLPEKSSIQFAICNLQFAIIPFILLNLTSCQIGGSKSFIQGDTVEENNARYTGDPVTGDWVIMNLLDEPESLNPYTSTSASARYIYSYIYESFLDTRRQPPWDEVPLLVEDLPQVSDDHLTYHWKLREDTRWHDGKLLTMQDAAFSLKALVNPYVDDLPTKPYYAELDSFTLEGDYVMTMYLSQSYFLHLEFLGSFMIYPRHIFDDKGLMDDLSYFQVKNGGAFGYIADLLDARPDVDIDALPDAVALQRVEKSIESVTEGKLRWKKVIGEIGGFPNAADAAKLTMLLDYLDANPDGAPAANLARDAKRSVELVLGTLPPLSPPREPGGRKITLPPEPRGSHAPLPPEPRGSHAPLPPAMRGGIKGGAISLDSLRTLCRDIHTRIQTFGEEFNKHPYNRAPTVGSGPYKFERWVTGQEIVLKRNEDYWRGEGYAYLDKIIWRVLTDYTASLVALKNGEVDFMENLQTIQYLTMTNRRKFLDNFVKSTFVIPQYSYLGWRCTHPIFSDRRVRRAMTLMVRREELRDKLLFGFAEIVTGSFYKYGPDYDSTIVPYPYDPEQALELLHEAGWEDTDGDGILDKDTLKFAFEMLLPSGSQFAEQLASVYREDLYMIGIEMNIRRLEWSVFINNYIRNHNFDACYLGWVFGMKGDPKQVWHSQSSYGRGSNHIEFRNATVDSIIDAARVEFDDSTRVAMFHRFLHILHEEQPYTFLFSTMSKPAYSKRFKGVKWYPFRPGYQFDEWFVPRDEQARR